MVGSYVGRFRPLCLCKLCWLAPSSIVVRIFSTHTALAKSRSCALAARRPCWKVRVFPVGLLGPRHRPPFSLFRRRRMIRMAGIIEKLQVVDAPAESCALRRASLIRAIVALIHGFCGKDWDTWQRNTGVDRWKILGNHFSSCDASWIGHGTHDFRPTFKLANSLWHHRPHSPFNFFGKKTCAPNVVRDHNFYLFRPWFFNRYEWRHCRGDSAKADQARVSTQPILVFHCTKRRLHWSGPTTTQRGRCNEHLVESRRMTYRICWRHPTHGKKPNFRSSS